MTPTRVAGIVLAAGASRRLGTPKPLLRDQAATPFVVRASRQLQDAGCDPVVVVSGAEYDAITEALATLDVTVLHNEGWAEGMASTIRCGISRLEADRARSDDVGAVILVACDMPSVTSKHLHALIDRSDGGTVRVASSYRSQGGDDVLGIPALLPRADWAHLQLLTGDRGARALFASPDTASVFLPDGHLDIDTPEDLAAWRAATANHSSPGSGAS